MPAVKVKTMDVIVAYNALQILANRKLPIKAAYALSRLTAQLKPEFDLVEEKRIEIVKSLSEPDANGNVDLTDKPAELKEFKAQFEEITSTELEVFFAPLPISLFGDIEIEPAILTNLALFLTE